MAKAKITRNRRDAHMWTKADIKKVATLWEKSTVEEICEELGLRKDQLTYIIMHMRKAGFDLPRKHKIGYIQNLLRECYLETKDR